ncbi:hypothetical protein AX14_000532 [Amanita brunnescens Koide BX004]|nr:hypothetical protein AX14_000532 [Amanita brunnescens Koide BX004]
MGSDGSQVGQRLIPEEPISIVLNFGISPDWQTIDLTTMIFPCNCCLTIGVYEREFDNVTNVYTEEYIALSITESQLECRGQREVENPYAFFYLRIGCICFLPPLCQNSQEWYYVVVVEGSPRQRFSVHWENRLLRKRCIKLIKILIFVAMSNEIAILRQLPSRTWG